MARPVIDRDEMAARLTEMCFDMVNNLPEEVVDPNIDFEFGDVVIIVEVIQDESHKRNPAIGMQGTNPKVYQQRALIRQTLGG